MFFLSTSDANIDGVIALFVVLVGTFMLIAAVAVRPIFVGFDFVEFLGFGRWIDRSLNQWCCGLRMRHSFRADLLGKRGDCDDGR